jgi:hypothetical protein
MDNQEPRFPDITKLKRITSNLDEPVYFGYIVSEEKIPLECEQLVSIGPKPIIEHKLEHYYYSFNFLPWIIPCLSGLPRTRCLSITSAVKGIKFDEKDDIEEFYIYPEITEKGNLGPTGPMAFVNYSHIDLTSQKNLRKIGLMYIHGYQFKCPDTVKEMELTYWNEFELPDIPNLEIIRFANMTKHDFLVDVIKQKYPNIRGIEFADTVKGDSTLTAMFK